MSEGSGVAQTRRQSTRTLFDRFAGRCSQFVSRAPFFTFCVLLVVLWAPTYFLVGNFDTYQLIINTPTTITSPSCWWRSCRTPRSAPRRPSSTSSTPWPTAWPI
jgi:hypothetical protein